MDMVLIINQMIMLMLMLAVGYVAAKCRLMDEAANSMLTRLVLNIALPSTVLYSVMGGNATMSGNEALTFMGLVIVVYAITIGAALFSPKLLRAPKEDAGLYRFMVAFANVGFMGYPVSQAIFGPESVFYVALFCMGFNILTYTVGVVFIAGDTAKINLKLLVTPVLIATIISVILFMTSIEFIPAVITQTVGVFDKLTTPLSMIVVGASLGRIPFREVFTERRVYLVSLLRLIIIPLIVWCIFKLFVYDVMMLGVLTVLAGMPVAALANMFSIQYKKNAPLAAKTIFLTTLLSMVTIPLVVYLLLM